MVHETIYYLPHLAKTSIVQSTVYGVLMSFVLNKHITIFTDNDMYYTNVATLGNRSPILNEHTINYIWNLCVFICLSKCQCLFILLHIELYYYTFNQCRVLLLYSHSLYMRHQLSLMIQQIYLLNHHYQTSYHTKLSILFSY